MPHNIHPCVRHSWATSYCAPIALLILANALWFHFGFWRRSQRSLEIARLHEHDHKPSSQYIGYDVWGLILFFAIASILGYCILLLLRALGEAGLPLTNASDLAFPPDAAIWAIPSLFMAILGAMPFADGMSRAVLRDRYQDYINVGYRRRSRNLWLLPWLNWFCAVGAIALTALAADWYTLFRTHEIVINRMIGFGEEHRSYSQVADIASARQILAPNGTVKNRPHIAIRFSDGTVWTSVEGSRSSNAARDADLVRLLEERTALKIQEFDVIPW